jgi:hypothetical protein
MFDNAFPNSEQLFRDTFSLSDPVPELLKLIREHPVYPAVSDMLFVYLHLRHRREPLSRE